MSVNVSQVDLLGRTLDVAGLRHRTIAENIANVNTPGYTRLEVAFEEELANQLRDGSTADLRQVKPQVFLSPGGPVRADGNNVSLEEEMSNLSKNTLLYDTAAQLLTTRFGMLRTAVS